MKLNKWINNLEKDQSAKCVYKKMLQTDNAFGIKFYDADINECSKCTGYDFQCKNYEAINQLYKEELKQNE